MGGRIPDLTQQEMTERQRTLYAAMAGAFRGPVQGPFPLWVRNPDVGQKAFELVTALRDKTSPARPLRELAILLAARRFGGQYPWAIHAPLAKAAGLDEAVIEAIRTGQRPSFPAQDQETFYAALTELYDKGRISEPIYTAAEKALGRDTLLDLMSVASFYSGLALFLAAFDVPAPADAQTLPSS
jgi:4-carboxymuconolactone decarboxylase